MMSGTNKDLQQLRGKLSAQLKTWIPGNDALVEKELTLFDRLMSRRDFLKSTSFAAMAAVINQGCGSSENSNYNSPPSQWSELSAEPTLVGISEQASVNKIANIHAHADLMHTVATHKDLDVETNAVLEGCNSVAALNDTYSNPDGTGFKPYERSYGHPEIIHFEKEGTTVALKIYEECSYGEHGLRESTIATLTDQNYSSIYAANSSFHNRVENQKVAWHKMVAVVNDSDSQNSEQPLMLYYHALQPDLSETQMSYQGALSRIAQLNSELTPEDNKLSNLTNEISNVSAEKNKIQVPQPFININTGIFSSNVPNQNYETEMEEYDKKVTSYNTQLESLESQVQALVSTESPVQGELVTLNKIVQYYSGPWQSIDVIAEFKQQYEENFEYISFEENNQTVTINSENTKPEVKEVNSYKDAMGNSFIYGTIGFGSCFNFGFVVNFTSFGSIRPTLKFFTPSRLAPNKKGDSSNFLEAFNAYGSFYINIQTIQQAGHMDSETSISSVLEKFYFFTQQRFRPFFVVMNEDGTPSNNIIFSYRSIASGNSTYNPETQTFDQYSYEAFKITSSNVANTAQENSYNGFEDLFGNSADVSKYEYMCNRLDIVAISSFTDSNNSAGMEKANDSSYFVSVSSSFNNQSLFVEMSSLGIASLFLTDALQTVFDDSGVSVNETNANVTMNEELFHKTSVLASQGTFGTSMYDITSCTVVTATGYTTIESQDVGLKLQKTIVQFVENQFFELKPIEESKESFNTPQAGGESYQSVWYNNVSSYFGGKSLFELDFDFYCTLNHQGLINSYFLFKDESSATTNMLVTFMQSRDSGVTTPYGTSDVNLLTANYDQGVGATFYPPVPLSLGVNEWIPWYRVFHYGEVLYSSLRQTSKSSETRLQSYSNTNTTYSSDNMNYYYSIMDNIDGEWKQHALNVKVEPEQSYEYQTLLLAHAVELECVNCYEYQSAPENMQVEVRLGAQGIVVDHTDPGNPKSYKVNRIQGCFLTPSDAGHLSLEVHLGEVEGQANGAMFMYRAVNSSDIVYSQSVPQGTINSSSTDLTDFKSFNISYQVHGRQTTTTFNAKQPLAPEGAPTPGSTLDSYNSSQGGSANASTSSNAESAQKGYEKVYNLGKVDNDTKLIQCSSTSTSAQNETRSAMSLTQRVNPYTYSLIFLRMSSNGLRSVDLRCCSWIDNIADAAVHFVGHALHECEKIKIIADVVNDAEDVLKDVWDGIKDAATAVWDAVKELGDDIASDMVALAHAVDSLVDGIISFVKLCIKALAAILDFETAWNIGLEFNKVRNYHIDPNNKNNFYNFMTTEESSLKTSVNGTLSNFKKQVNNMFEDLDADKLDSTHNTTHSNKKHIDTTKTKHVSKHVHKGIAKSGTTTSSNNSSPDVSALAEVFNNTFSNTKTIANATNKSTQTVSNTLAANHQSQPSSITGEFQSLLQHVLDDVLDEFKVVLDGVIDIPTSIMDFMYNFEEELSSEVKSILDGISDILYWLTFTKVKLTSVSDLAHFISCYLYVVMATLIDVIVDVVAEIFGDKSAELDLVSPITDGSFFTNSTQKVVTTSLRSDSDDNTKVISYVAYYVASIMNDVFSLMVNSIQVKMGSSAPTNTPVEQLLYFLQVFFNIYQFGTMVYPFVKQFEDPDVGDEALLSTPFINMVLGALSVYVNCNNLIAPPRYNYENGTKNNLIALGYAGLLVYRIFGIIREVISNKKYKFYYLIIDVINTIKAVFSTRQAFQVTNEVKYYTSMLQNAEYATILDIVLIVLAIIEEEFFNESQ